MKKAVCEVCYRIVQVRDDFNDKVNRVYCCNDHRIILNMFDLMYGTHTQERKKL